MWLLRGTYLPRGPRSFGSCCRSQTATMWPRAWEPKDRAGLCLGDCVSRFLRQFAQLALTACFALAGMSSPAEADIHFPPVSDVWEVRSTGVNPTKACEVAPGVAWLIDSGSVLYTDDAFRTFSRQLSGASDVFALDRSNVWAVGGGSAWWSDDGGESWHKGLGTKNMDILLGVSFTSALQGTAVGKFWDIYYFATVVYTTNDGGRNWVRTEGHGQWDDRQIPWRKVFDAAGKEGWQHDGTNWVAHSCDGGRTWSRVAWTVRPWAVNNIIPLAASGDLILAVGNGVTGERQLWYSDVGGHPFHTSVIAGADRFSTCVESSRRAYPEGSDAIVVATAYNWPDALGGAALAGAADGPILLTGKDSMPESIVREIRRLGATRAWIVGGEGAVSPAVEGQLKSLLGDDGVKRVAGSNRLATAERVGAEVADVRADAFGGTAFVATALGFPDALSASPVSAAAAIPVYLTQPSAISPDTVKAMKAAGVSRVLILGGTAVVTSDVEATLESHFGDSAVSRISGSDRFATAFAVSDWGVQNAGLSWDGLGFAAGDSFSDALSGGVCQGVSGSVLVLTPTAHHHPTVDRLLVEHHDEISAATFYGGDAAIAVEARSLILKSLTGDRIW